MQTIVLYLRYIVWILLFASAYNTSLIYCFVIWCPHTNKRRPCSSIRSRAIRRLVFSTGKAGHVSTKAYCQLYLLPLQQRKQEEQNNSNLHKQASLKRCRLSICHSFHSTVVFSQRLTPTQHGSPPYTTASFKCTHTHLSRSCVPLNTAHI